MYSRGIVCISALIALNITACAVWMFSPSAQIKPEPQRLQAFGARVGQLPGSAGTWVVFSRDGKRILTGGDHEVCVWDTATLRPLTKPLRHPGPIVLLTDAQISDDGRNVVTAGYDNTARIWVAQTGKALAVLRHQGYVLSARFGRGGERVVTGGGDGRAKVWDSQTGRQLLSLSLRGTVRYAVFSPDGSMILTISDRPVENGDPPWSGMQEACLWDAATGRKLRRHNVIESGRRQPAAFSPDGTKVATALEKFVVVWDTRTGKDLFSVDAWVLSGPTDTVAFGPRGSRLLTGAGAGARLFNVATGGLVARLDAGGDATQAIFNSDGGRVLLAAAGGRVALCDAAGGKRLGYMRLPKRPLAEELPRADIPAIAFSPDGTEILIGDPVTDSTTVWRLTNAPQK